MRRAVKGSATPAPSRKVTIVQDKVTHKRGKVVRVYNDSWLLAEMEDGTWGLFKPDEVEPVGVTDVQLRA